MKELNNFRKFLNEGTEVVAIVRVDDSSTMNSIERDFEKGKEITIGEYDPDEGQEVRVHTEDALDAIQKNYNKLNLRIYDEFGNERIDLQEENVSEGADASYYAMTKAKSLAKKDGHDFDKLPKFARGKGVAHQQKYLDMAKEAVSENALGVDKGDGTFEMTPDIEIMGQKFNFSDICPSAHKLVQNQAIVHQGFSRTAPIVLNFAILHRDFFALEKAALGPQGIDVDTFKNDVTRLYTEILNVAEQLGVRKQAKDYMDMHMAKIKDAGFKASEPGGSSDRNFEEQLKEVRSRIASEVEGYTDLHENDVVLESFLGESNAERNPLRGIKNMFQAIIPLKLDTSPIGSLGYAKAIGIEGDLNAIQFFTEYPDRYEKYKDLLSQAKGFGVDINSSTNVLDAYNKISAAANEYELRENLEENKKHADDQLKFKKGDIVYFANVKGGKNLPMKITGPGKSMDSNRLDAVDGKEIVFPVKGGPGGKGMYAADDLVKENLNEEIEMVEPQRGHIFYKLNKDVDLELQTGSTSPTYAPGVLLHPVFGKTIIARKGQYIINFHGQLFYVDMDEKFATKVPKHEDSGNKESLAGALDIVDKAPKFNPGWKSYLNKPL